VFSCKVVVGISYSSNSLSRNVRDMTSSGLTTFPEFRHLKSIRAQGSKENVLTRKIWYVVRQEINEHKRRSPTYLRKPFI
jgi:hypothetical protein